MRRALIIVFANGRPQVASGPEVDYIEQRKRFKQLRVGSPEAREGIEGAEFWDSSRGCVKRLRFADSVDGLPDELFAEQEPFSDKEKSLIETIRTAGIDPEEVELFVLSGAMAPLTEPERELLEVFRTGKFDPKSVGLAPLPTIPEGEEPPAPGVTDTPGQESSSTSESAPEPPKLDDPPEVEDDGPTLDLPPESPKSKTSKPKK